MANGGALQRKVGNAPVKYRENQIRALKVNKPEKKYVGPFGNVRY